MKRKLTLRIDDQLIDRAKMHARRTGKSVSKLVANYFAILDTPIEDEIENLPPITRQLHGSLAGADVDEEDYRRHLIDKYGR